MKTIHKYPIEVRENQTVQMPEGAVVLSVDNQNGFLCVWAEVDTDRPMVDVMFLVCGTGHPLRTGTLFRFVGTVQIPPFVWHVFVSRAHVR